MGGSFLSNYIKSPARRYERTKMRITFDDVAGMQHAKSELQEVVEFLRSPGDHAVEVLSPPTHEQSGRDDADDPPVLDYR